MTKKPFDLNDPDSEPTDDEIDQILSSAAEKVKAQTERMAENSKKLLEKDKQNKPESK